MRLVSLLLPALLVQLALPAPAPAPAHAGAPAGDARFGLVGTGGRAFAARFALPYFTLEGNYSADHGKVFSSVHPGNDPDPGFSVVREVAKLNVRTDSLGETNAQFQARLNAYAKALASWYPVPSFMRGAKPVFAWYSPDAAALAAAESLQITETIRREKARNPAVTGTVWEIGNEPNLFPAITPDEYAALFAAYRRIIKAEDPSAVVALGALFLPEPAADLKARLGEELETKMRAELKAAGLYNAVNGAGYFDDLVNDLRNTLLSRMLALPAREYLKQVLAATSERPDLVTLHAYPYDDRAPALDSAGLRHLLDTTLAGVSAQLISQGAPARIWITEFGNIEQGRDADGVASRMSQLVAAFQAQEPVQRWFHYKGTGADEQFALFSSGAPPLTRLAEDPAFSPATGDFPCARLNAAGRMYYRLSHGGSDCAEPPAPDAPPSVDSVRPERPAVAEGATLRLRAHATDPEGQALAWVWLRQNGDTLGRGSEVDFTPGFRDAGTEALRLDIIDAAGMKTVHPVHVAIANTPLAPALANTAGGALSPGAALKWAWAGSFADPDFHLPSVVAHYEIRTDSASSEPVLKLEAPGVGGAAGFAGLKAPAGPVWIRLFLRDGDSRVSPWSATVRLQWAGAASRLAALPPALDLTAYYARGRTPSVFRLALPQGGPVSLQLVGADGSLQGVLFEGRLSAGWHDIPARRAGESAPGRGPLVLRLVACGEARNLLIPYLP